MARKIIAEVFPYDRIHDLYQEYYRRAMKASLGMDSGFVESPRGYSVALLRKLLAVRRSYRLRALLKVKLLPKVLDSLASVISRGASRKRAPDFGPYRFITSDRDEIRVCIDTRDPPGICEAGAAACDVYFKSNYWPSHRYPANVLPVANMNPLVGRNLDLFRNSRTVPKEYDLFAFFRVWGGSDEVEGIEHNMALLEAISKAECRTYLLAYLVSGEISVLSKRLDSLGIPWTLKAMPAPELWKRAAKARLNIVRLGMHECVPWRMTDILAMGGVPVLDYAPKTLWPEPLVEGKHYLNLDFTPGRGGSNKVAETIDSWLADESLISSISRNTAEYFDQYLAPEKLGESLLRKAEEMRNAKPSAE